MTVNYTLERKEINGEFLTKEDILKKYKNAVHKAVKPFIKKAKMHGVEYEDLFSEGQIGLLNAYDSYDDTLGLKFMTYGFSMIRWAIQRFMRDQNAGPKFSRKVKEWATKVTVDDSVNEIVEKLGIKTDEAKLVVDYKRNFLSVSTNQLIAGNGNGDKDMTIEDTLSTQDDFSSVFVDEFLDYLKENYPNHHIVVKGLLSNQSQAQIGEVLRVSQVQVSRMIKVIREIYEDYKGDEDMRKLAITKEQYTELKKQGMKNKEICLKLNISGVTLNKYKNKWKDQKPETPKEEKAKTIGEYPQLIEVLKKKIADLERQVKEHPEMMRKFTELASKNSRLEEEVKVLIQKRDQIISATDDVEEELNQWRNKANLYAQENENLVQINGELQIYADASRREANAARALLKEVL